MRRQPEGLCLTYAARERVDARATSLNLAVDAALTGALMRRTDASQRPVLIDD
jgi:hypothetical protein